MNLTKFEHQNTIFLGFKIIKQTQIAKTFSLFMIN